MQKRRLTCKDCPTGSTGLPPDRGSGRISRSSDQRGFALLLVFALAAAAAIFLYMQLPRVAFEAQRDREELLMQRGKEYRRGIELFVRKNNKYPERLEDLERQQNLRFIRRRYNDPLTGKDDWRIIRINVAGELEDSLVQKKRAVGGQLAANTAVDEEAPVAENTALARQRSGDDLLANAEFPGGGAGAGVAAMGIQDSQDPSLANAAGTPVDPLDAGLVPLLDASGNLVQSGTTAGGNAQASQPPGSPSQPGQALQPGQSNQSSQPAQPRLGPGGVPIIENPAAYVSASAGGQNAGQQGGGTQLGGNAPPAVGAPARGEAGQPGQTAAGLIGNLLTTPVPGGLAGIQQRRGLTPGAAGAAQGFGAGIAGVASRIEMRGIKVYEEQDSIHKWEFVFDARQQATRNQQNAAGGARNPTVPGMPGGSSNPTMNPGNRSGRGNFGFPPQGPGAPPAPPGRRP